MSVNFKDAATHTIDVDGTRFVYRKVGQKGEIPLVLLPHLMAVMDDWDPAVVDGLAARHEVLVFDNRGIGKSGGSAPSTVEAMAIDAISFIRTLGYRKVDLFGFSLGGFIAQVIAQRAPDLVRKIILAGTVPAGGEGIANVGAVLQDGMAKAGASGKHPKHFLFFTQTVAGQRAADEFLARLNERTEDRDDSISNEAMSAQLAAVIGWGTADVAQKAKLPDIPHPVLVANGDHDVMAPTINSFDLLMNLSNAQLTIFPEAGHAGVFQHHASFVDQAIEFLN
jgi:pimeloyl-ACP methyl ester carboxylesterase